VYSETIQDPLYQREGFACFYYPPDNHIYMWYGFSTVWTGEEYDYTFYNNSLKFSASNVALPPTEVILNETIGGEYSSPLVAGQTALVAATIANSPVILFGGNELFLLVDRIYRICS
jgi:hypothetical protein